MMLVACNAGADVAPNGQDPESACSERDHVPDYFDPTEDIDIGLCFGGQDVEVSAALCTSIISKKRTPPGMPHYPQSSTTALPAKRVRHEEHSSSGILAPFEHMPPASGSHEHLFGFGAREVHVKSFDANISIPSSPTAEQLQLAAALEEPDTYTGVPWHDREPQMHAQLPAQQRIIQVLPISEIHSIRV
jgi:hypothetical protein